MYFIVTKYEQSKPTPKLHNRYLTDPRKTDPFGPGISCYAVSPSKGVRGGGTYAESLRALSESLPNPPIRREMKEFAS